MDVCVRVRGRVCVRGRARVCAYVCACVCQVYETTCSTINTLVTATRCVVLSIISFRCSVRFSFSGAYERGGCSA